MTGDETGGEFPPSSFSLQQALICEMGDYSREGFWAKVQGQGEVCGMQGLLLTENQDA